MNNMQSQQVKESSSSTPTTFHFKVQLKDEFRRFALENPSFSTFETALRSSFLLPNDALKFKFQDDEKDWVVFSSDFEFQHALQLSGSPLRVSIFLDQPQVAQIQQPEPNTVVEEIPLKRGPCTGRGGKCGRGPAFTKEERDASKKTRITARISMLEGHIADPALSSERERVISWKLSKLREKLETLSLEKPEIENSETEKPWRHRGPHGHGPCHPHFDEVETSGRPHGPRGCGGRGRGCGRGRWAREAECGQQEVEKDGDNMHILGKKWVVPKQTWIQFQEAKENLRVARRSGDAEAIKKAFEAFVVVKQQKKENRFPKVVQ